MFFLFFFILISIFFCFLKVVILLNIYRCVNNNVFFIVNFFVQFLENYIVDSRGLLIVMSTIGGYCSNTTVPLWQKGQIQGAKRGLNACGIVYCQGVIVGCMGWMYTIGMSIMDVSKGCQQRMCTNGCLSITNLTNCYVYSELIQNGKDTKISLIAMD